MIVINVYRSRRADVQWIITEVTLAALFCEHISPPCVNVYTVLRATTGPGVEAQSGLQRRLPVLRTVSRPPGTLLWIPDMSSLGLGPKLLGSLSSPLGTLGSPPLSFRVTLSTSGIPAHFACHMCRATPPSAYGATTDPARIVAGYRHDSKHTTKISPICQFPPKRKFA